MLSVPIRRYGSRVSPSPSTQKSVATPWLGMRTLTCSRNRMLPTSCRVRSKVLPVCMAILPAPRILRGLLRAEPRVEEPVDRAAVLGDRLPMPPLQRVARLLEDPGRRGIPLEDAGLEPDQVQGRERPARDGAEGLGRDPSPPVSLAQPVADLGGAPVHVAAALQTDPAGGLAVHDDREGDAPLHPAARLDPPPRVVERVG